MSTVPPPIGPTAVPPPIGPTAVPPPIGPTAVPPPMALTAVPPPMALLAELTHRCPYCSNPMALAAASQELGTGTWARVFAEAAALGCLQVHLSGGEPMVRRDLPALVAAAAGQGLYTNLITSGMMLTEQTLAPLCAAGLDHVQLSVQDALADPADTVSGLPGSHAQKLAAARAVRAAGIPLTVNAVVHRRNLVRLPAIIAMAEAMGAGRLEVAHVQYYGWALANQQALLPDRAQLDAATAVVETERARLAGAMVIDYVLPDYHAERPKPCMAGWGRRFIVVSPAGRVLPCHAAESLPDMTFPDVQTASLRSAWENSPAFDRFRGTAWMTGPCRACPQAEQDWGGCRCQAYALTGDAAATDPACALSPRHGLLAETVASGSPTVPLVYRQRRARPAPVAPRPPAP